MLVSVYIFNPLKLLALKGEVWTYKTNLQVSMRSYHFLSGCFWGCETIFCQNTGI